MGQEGKIETSPGGAPAIQRVPSLSNKRKAFPENQKLPNSNKSRRFRWIWKPLEICRKLAYLLQSFIPQTKDELARKSNP
jgi:hypothetical protein